MKDAAVGQGATRRSATQRSDTQRSGTEETEARDVLTKHISVEDMLALGKRLAGSGEDKGVGLELAGRLLRVRDRAGMEQPLVANAAQLAFEQARGRQNIVLKARQMGMTTWVSGRFFLKTITGRGVMTVQVAQTREAAESIFRMVQRFWECLPEEHRTGPLKRSRANVRQMVFSTLDSEFRVVSAADKNAGRGLTIHNLHCSELSRWPGDPRETLAGLRAALAPAGELVLESTPNGAYGCFYDEWTQAEQSGLARHFLPWWFETTYVTAPVTDYTDEELELIQRHNLSAAQIGYRRGLEASYRGMMTQEFAEDPERCFRATGNCCFEIDSIERRLQELGEPAEKKNRGALHIFLPARAEKQYLVAVDPSGGGITGDFGVAQVIDLATGAQCAELQQRLTPRELSQASAQLAREYNGAPIVVERNNHGSAVLAFLDISEHYANVYAVEGTPGWLTSAASKPRIVGLLGALLVEQPELFRSRRLLAECRTFVTRTNGSSGAVAGAHDDCVMAMAIAQQVRNDMLQKPKG